MVDYLQLLHSPRKHENRHQEVSEISRALKALAKELNIPILALSQLSRGVDSRPDKRPMLSDLRESGAIEQDADIVSFIYRPEYYKIDAYEDGSPTQGVSEIIIAKHRNGAVGDVKLRFIADFARFDDYSHGGDGFSAEDVSAGIKNFPSKMNSMDDDTPF
mgnify:CR=1 FL=1